MYPASVEYLNRQRINSKLRRWTLGATVDLGFAVCEWLVSDFYVYLSIVFSTCYYLWIYLLVWLLTSFIFITLFFCFNNIFLIFYFNNFFIYFILFFLSFYSPISSEPCGWQGLGAPAECQAWASEVGQPSSGHWTTRTSWPHVISKGKSSPRDLQLNAKTQLHARTSKLQCWTPHWKDPASSTKTQAPVPSTMMPTQATEPTLGTGADTKNNRNYRTGAC